MHLRCNNNTLHLPLLLWDTCSALVLHVFTNGNGLTHPARQELFAEIAAGNQKSFLRLKVVHFVLLFFCKEGGSMSNRQVKRLFVLKKNEFPLMLIHAFTSSLNPRGVSTKKLNE